MKNKITLIATMNVLPWFEAEFKTAITNLAIETRKEAGCELFMINTRNDSPQTIVAYEVYESPEAFQLHKEYAHTGLFFDYVKGKIKNDEIEIIFLTELGD